MTYIDTSIVRAYLPVEDRRPADALWERALTASRLVEYETWTRLHARNLYSINSMRVIFRNNGGEA